MADLTRVWNVDVRTPTWGPPTHAMQIFRYAEEGSIRLLWIIGRVVQWFRRRLPVEPNVERRRSLLFDYCVFIQAKVGAITDQSSEGRIVFPISLDIPRGAPEPGSV